MSLYDKSGADRLSVQDPQTGRAFSFPLPYETDDPAEIRALLDGGAVETKRPPMQTNKERDEQ